MAESRGGSGRRGPRGSKAQIDAVRRNAEKAGKELDREQEESVGHLAKALGQISEGEALAHLDTRLAFLERQVERLTARRDEADRGIQGELTVMRARIDDALEAVAGTSQDQKDTLAGQQKRFSQLILESEHRSSSVSETLRQELVSKVQDSLTRLQKYEARLRGEMKAFEEGASERARAVSESLAKSREEIEQRLDDAVEEIGNNVDGSIAQLEKSTEELGQRLHGEVTDAASKLEDEVSEVRSVATSGVSGLTEKLETRLAESTGELETRITEKSGELEERVAVAAQSIEEALEDLTKASSASEQHLTELETSINFRLDSEKRETDARFSEWVAEVKMETQRLREIIEKAGELVDERADGIRRDVLNRVQTAEDKAATAAIRLESIFTQLKREVGAGEEEWSERLKENDGVLASLLPRVEELLGRVSSSEAKVAADRGSREALVQSIAGRVDHVEERIREAVEEVNAKHATKLEVLSSQVSGIAQSEVNAEEKLGAVDYLKRRVAEMSEQLDEIMVKVNAIGRYMTKPQNAQKLGLPFLPAEVAERLSAIERAVAELASRPSPTATSSIPKEFSERLDSIERTISALTAGIMQVDKPKTPGQPVQEKIVDAPTKPSQPSSSSPSSAAEGGTRRQAPWAQTILPQKRRR